MVTARQFAQDNGISERTVQGWAKRKVVVGAQKIGLYWIAPRSAWSDAAAKVPKQGRPKSKGVE